MSSPAEDRIAHLARRHRLVGRSRAFLRSLALVDKLSRCDATVLIRGETGTGKELAARAMHYAGRRAGQPFVAVNCGAIADSLIESELFGAERGAYTDARESRAGLVAQADGGTLLLDEIDALDAKAQVVLLRFLEDREYRPVGGRATHADVRIVAASNRSLTRLVEAGRFREDLLFRLNLVCLRLPPLRERGDDVLLLARDFSARYAREYGQALRPLHGETTDAFMRYDWPGNVRELQNLVHRQFLISDATMIRVPDPGADARAESDAPDARATADVTPDHDPGADFKTAKARAIASFERRYLAELLCRTNGNVSHAARLAGKERSSLGKLIKKHGLVRAQFQRPRTAP